MDISIGLSLEIGYPAMAGSVRRKMIDGSTVQAGEIFVLLLMRRSFYCLSYLTGYDSQVRSQASAT